MKDPYVTIVKISCAFFFWYMNRIIYTYCYYSSLCFFFLNLTCVHASVINLSQLDSQTHLNFDIFWESTSIFCCCRNYVVQLILDMKIPSATSNLISQFEGNYVHLSKQKFSSYVVEKCIMTFDEENQSRIIYEMISSAQFPQLLQDPHANYVIQRALKVSQVWAKCFLLSQVVFLHNFLTTMYVVNMTWSCYYYHIWKHH